MIPGLDEVKHIIDNGNGTYTVVDIYGVQQIVQETDGKYLAKVMSETDKTFRPLTPRTDKVVRSIEDRMRMMGKEPILIEGLPVKKH